MDNVIATDRFAARLLMVSFFLPAKVQALVVIAASVYFVVRTFISKEPVPAKNYALALFIGSCYLLYLFSIPLTPHGHLRPLLKLCETRASMLFLPFVFAIVAPHFRRLILGELSFFVCGCLISCIVGNADFIYHCYFVHNGLYQPSHVIYRTMFESATGIHPTYMGMYLCFSICVLLLSSAASTRAGQIVKYATVYLLLVLLLALLAKSALIALALIFVHYAYMQRASLYKYWLLVLSLFAGVAAACFFIPFIGQRVSEISRFFGNEKAGIVTDNSMNVRQLIFNVDTRLLKQNWLTGVGPGRLLHMLRERYFFYSLANGHNISYYDPHNEYFSEWLSFGVIGIVLFLTIVVIQFTKAISAKDHLYLYLLIIFCTTFFTETVLSRQEGVLFYAVFTSLLFFRNTKDVGVRRYTSRRISLCSDKRASPIGLKL